MSNFPTIRVYRPQRANDQLPLPLRGKVTADWGEGEVELHRVRHVTTDIGVNDAQTVTVTFIGRLEIIDEVVEE